ncbi:MAG: hypothetical protein IJZ87_03450 [Bacteroidales bacterium]|nr:hypothetical protein [Bacteroidales bacterium]
MKKLSVLTLLLLMATFAFANNNETKMTSEISSTIEHESVQHDEATEPGIYYYGSKAGVFRPCKGNVEMVCKKIIFSSERDKVIVTDGLTRIVVDINKVNFEDSSVDM